MVTATGQLGPPGLVSRSSVGEHSVRAMLGSVSTLKMGGNVVHLKDRAIEGSALLDVELKDVADIQYTCWLA